ncbi:Ig-like domain-containing protein [Ramlibacter sp. AN1133]|uniref:Ig-like domain-containing protein n=1 Tax=Ramlibacter sp. AN1133 TaxID=3133429 RepID=UPI0030BF750D
MTHTPKLSLIALAAALAVAAAPAHAVLERMGPISKAPTIGGYPAWFQDTTGVTMEFCDPQTQAELDLGWCVLIPPGPVFPESFPNQFFNEHFYYAATNVLLDTGNAFRARLTVGLEAAFANNAVVDGDQMTFGRVRVFIPRLPFDGDYRVITPYTDISYYGQKAGDRIFETSDIGLKCVGTFTCTLDTAIGPFLLPSPTAGGPEVPPMPDLAAAPPGTDPFYDQVLALGAATADPGTGQKYIADPKRIGPVTGTTLPDFTAYDIDPSGATPGIPSTRNHNTFRVEVRVTQPDHNGHVFYTVDGETNFTVNGRLMTGTLPGNVSSIRSTYKADAAGNITDLDVYATAAPTRQARIPAQPVVAPVTPALSFYDTACAGAIGVDPVTGLPIVNPPPYTAPAGIAHNMAETDKDFWGQSQPGGVPPDYVCLVDSTARNAAGQVVPAYYLKNVTDQVSVTAASFNGPGNGTLTVSATSSDPTAVLSLAGYGPADAGTPGVVVGRGAGTGLDLVNGTASVNTLQAPPSSVQIVSTKGGATLLDSSTLRGAAVLVGIPSAANDAATMFEDCSATAATACAPGQSLVVDLLANDTVALNGVQTNLRTAVTNNLATISVTTTPPRLGTATVTPDGIVTYTPSPNANGVDNINYTVTVDGQVSNQALLAITITPVNDLPVAGPITVGAVVSKTNIANLISNSTDPDGNTDVKDAVILTWPAGLGAQPVPVNGGISYVPTSTGNFSITYRVKDAAGVLSANTATGTLTVIGAETLTYTKKDFKGAANIGGGATTRWTVSGTDTVREFQTVTIAYADGTIRSTGQVCNGTAAIPACVVGTAVVDATGTFLYDKVGTPGGASDPTDTTFWSTLPKNIRTFSSAPVLGGATSAAIVLR